MKQKEIEFLQKLDPDCLSGTIQAVLMDKNVDKMDFTTVLTHLLSLTIAEKQALLEENRKLSKVLKDHNLYRSELIL